MAPSKPSTSSTPERINARAVMRALRLSASPRSSRSTPDASRPSPQPSVASPSLRHQQRRQSRSPFCSMTEEEYNAMDLELTHDLQQDQEDEEEEQRRLNDEHKDPMQHSPSTASSRSPSITATVSPHSLLPPSSPFLSPESRSGRQAKLRSALALTQQRLREKERHLQMAAEMGDSLIRQQEESEERERALHSSMVALQQERDRLRDDLDQAQQRHTALLIQLKDAQARADDDRQRAQQAADALDAIEAQRLRERDRDRRRDEQQQRQASQQVMEENATLHAQLAALQQQHRALQDKLQTAQADRDDERRKREDAEREAREWSQTVEERDAAAALLVAQHKEETDELRYRLSQAHDALPLTPPVLPDATPAPVMEGMESEAVDETAGLAVVVGPADTRDAGRNRRLSTMPYASLLAELESELLEEVESRTRDATQTAKDKNSTKHVKRREQNSRALTDKENRQTPPDTSTAAAPVDQKRSAPPMEPLAAPPVPPKLSYFSWLTGGRAGPSTTPAAPVPAEPAAPAGRHARGGGGGSGSGGVDVLREYFHLAALSVKLSSVDTNLRACNANVGTLYEQAVEQDVPFHRWHAWLQATMKQMGAADRVLYSHGVSVRHRPSLSAGLHRGVVTGRKPQLAPGGAAAAQTHAQLSRPRR